MFKSLNITFFFYYFFQIFIFRVPHNVPRLLINREKAGHRSGIMSMLGMGGGFEFDSKENTRDVLWLGDCDDGCKLLADKLGFGVSTLILENNQDELHTLSNVIIVPRKNDIVNKIISFGM